MRYARTVLLVDHHALTRLGLEVLLRRLLPHARVGLAGSADEALAFAPRLAPDLIFAALDMPGEMRGALLCGRLRSAAPGSRIVAVAEAPRGPEAKAWLAAGAAGVLAKDDPQLDASLRRVLAGAEPVLSPSVAQRLAVELAAVLRGEEGGIRLTMREREVLELLAEGCSNRDIAARLVVATGTVKDHVRSLLKKLGAESRLQAVRRATDYGLI